MAREGERVAARVGEARAAEGHVDRALHQHGAAAVDRPVAGDRPLVRAQEGRRGLPEADAAEGEAAAREGSRQREKGVGACLRARLDPHLPGFY